jgi:hypothetical protein
MEIPEIKALITHPYHDQTVWVKGMSSREVAEELCLDAMTDKTLVNPLVQMYCLREIFWFVIVINPGHVH